MLNNPMQLMNMFKTAQNPYALMRQIGQNNPQMQQMIQSLQGKNPQELEQYARNLAQSKGINLSQFLNQYGISVPQ